MMISADPRGSVRSHRAGRGEARAAVRGSCSVYYRLNKGGNKQRITDLNRGKKRANAILVYNCQVCVFSGRQNCQVFRSLDRHSPLPKGKFVLSLGHLYGSHWTCYHDTMQDIDAHNTRRIMSIICS